MVLSATTIMVVVSLAVVSAIGLNLEQRRRRVVRIVVDKIRSVPTPDPTTIYPLIDPILCVGCGSCVEACPENHVLEVHEGRAQLVDVSHRVGHGVCKTACPTMAIELVFGTAKRGVMVPQPGADLQTSVPGIYVAGELGGFGLIRTAMNQGVQVITNLGSNLKPGQNGDVIDVAIVGGGPAGIAAALACGERGYSHAILDQDGLGGAILHYPRRKLVMTAPIKLPMAGMMNFREISKEELLEYFTEIVERCKVKLRPQGTGKRALVVGGGNSAVEAGGKTTTYFGEPPRAPLEAEPLAKAS